MAISLVSCDKPNEDATNDTKYPVPDSSDLPRAYCTVMEMIRPVLSINVSNQDTNLNSSLQWNRGINFHLRIGNHIPIEQEVEIPELSELFSSQYKQCSSAFNDWMGYGYYNECVSNAYIITDKPMFGRDAGEDLSDLFYVGLYNHPIFSYPDGVLQNPEGGTTIMSPSEWMECRIMMVDRYAIILKDEFVQEMGSLQPEVTFTISITTLSGEKVQNSVVQKYHL